MLKIKEKVYVVRGKMWLNTFTFHFSKNNPGKFCVTGLNKLSVSRKF